MIYEHRESSPLPIIIVAFFAVVVVVLSTVDSGSSSTGFLIGSGMVAAAIALAFNEVHSSVSDTEVVARFRFGWPARHIPVDAIIDYGPVRNPWWYGFGIRLIPGGMLYSVWGRSAVEIVYNDATRGRRMLRVGTDDGHAFSDAIRQARRS